MEAVAKARPLYVEGKSHRQPSNGRVVLVTNINVCIGEEEQKLIRIRHIAKHDDHMNISLIPGNRPVIESDGPVSCSWLTQFCR